MFSLRAAALGVALCLTAAAPAAADSITYIKDGNVWAAAPDGSKQTQITQSGGYFWVSQADDGTMITLVGGEKLRKLSHTGDVLAEFPTYVSDGSPVSGPVTKFHGPFEPQISTDGSLVAYEWMNDAYYNGGFDDCNEQTVPPCYELKQSQGVGITHSDRFTGFEEYGLLTGWIAPSWTARGWLLRSSVALSPNEDTVFNNVGPGKGDDEMRRWFWDDHGGLGVDDVELAKDESFAVGVAGFYDEFLRFYRPLYDPYNAPAQKLGPFEDNPQVVEKCFDLTNPAGGKFKSPTIAPDGRGVAYVTGDGLRVVGVPDVKAACAGAGEDKLVIPGATSPDWGPADVPVIPAGGSGGNGGGSGAGGGNGGGNGPGSSDGPRPGGGLAVSAARAKLRQALRKGMTVTVTGAGAGRVRAVASRGKTRVASGSAVARGGKATVTLRFTGKAKRSLARRHRVTLTVRVTAPSAPARSVSITLTR